MAFTPVKTDMLGNVKKIRDRQLAAPAESENLQDLVPNELKTKKHVATEGLVWLVRYVVYCFFPCSNTPPTYPSIPHSHKHQTPKLTIVVVDLTSPASPCVPTLQTLPKSSQFLSVTPTARPSSPITPSSSSPSSPWP